MAAVDQHGELDRARPAEVAQRVERRADRSGRSRGRRRRARRPCRRCRRPGCRCGSSARAGARRRSSRYIVTSRRADRDVAALDLGPCGRRAGAARDTPRVGMPSRTRSSAPLLRSTISWATRVSARVISAPSRTVRVSSGVLAADTLRPPSPPHRTDLKVVGRCRPYPTPGHVPQAGGGGSGGGVGVVTDRARRPAAGTLRSRPCAFRRRKHPPNGPSRVGANGGSRSVTSPVTLGATGIPSGRCGARWRRRRGPRGQSAGPGRSRLRRLAEGRAGRAGSQAGGRPASRCRSASLTRPGPSPRSLRCWRLEALSMPRWPTSRSKRTDIGSGRDRRSDPRPLAAMTWSRFTKDNGTVLDMGPILVLLGGFVFAVGTVVGSFLNVCIYRIPWEKSVIWPGSRCPRCHDADLRPRQHPDRELAGASRASAASADCQSPPAIRWSSSWSG